MELNDTLDYAEANFCTEANTILDWDNPKNNSAKSHFSGMIQNIPKAEITQKHPLANNSYLFHFIEII